MTKNYLFPARFQKLGWFLLIPFGLLFICFCFCTNELKIELNVPVFAIYDDIGLFNNSKHWFAIIENDIMDEITSIGLIASLLLIAFSKEKDEDEYISQIRSNSIVWAFLVNFSFVIFSEIFFYGMFFFNILCLNLFFTLFLFVIKFKIAIYKLRKTTKDEK